MSPLAMSAADEIAALALSYEQKSKQPGKERGRHEDRKEPLLSLPVRTEDSAKRSFLRFWRLERPRSTPRLEPKRRSPRTAPASCPLRSIPRSPSRSRPPRSMPTRHAPYQQRGPAELVQRPGDETGGLRSRLSHQRAWHLAVIKAFLPVLERAPEGATIVNVLSLTSLPSFSALGYPRNRMRC